MLEVSAGATFGRNAGGGNRGDDDGIAHVCGEYASLVRSERAATDRRTMALCLFVSLCAHVLLWGRYPHLQIADNERTETVVARHRADHRIVLEKRHRLAMPPVRRVGKSVASKPLARPSPMATSARVVASLAPRPVQRAIARTPKAEPTVRERSTPASTATFTPEQSAALRLPTNWAAQDMANTVAADTTLYLDFKKARGAFVPRVFLVHLQTTYLSDPTLHGAVEDILGSLRQYGTHVLASKPQRVCGGRFDGWFLSYSRPRGDPPGQYENVLFMQGDTIFRVMYTRPFGEPEDPKTRAALDTLCPT